MSTLTANLVPMFGEPNAPLVQVNGLASSQIIVSRALAIDQTSSCSFIGTLTLQYSDQTPTTFNFTGVEAPQDICNMFNSVLGSNGSCDMAIQQDGVHLVMGLFSSGANNVFNITATQPPEDAWGLGAMTMATTVGANGQPSTIVCESNAWAQYSPAQDTSITVNGVTYNGSTNTFPAVIPGFVITVSEQD